MEAQARELPLCPLCKNTGVHLCPDVAEPILISCNHKHCPITALQKECDNLRQTLEKCVKALEWYADCGQPGDFSIVDRDRSFISDFSVWGDRAKRVLAKAQKLLKDSRGGE